MPSDAAKRDDMPSGALTSNDRRVLEGIEWASREWDGFTPHGIANWTAIRRMKARGLVEFKDYGICQSCPEPHDALIFTLTSLGVAELEKL